MATYLVTQATGIQGQWTVKHLLASGAQVHALVRNPEKVPPALKAPGVTIFQGDGTDFDQVFNAAQGCAGVFLNTFPAPGFESKQAKTVVAAAKKAGAKSVVAATTFCTGYKDMWDDEDTRQLGLYEYYASKAEVEDIVRTAGFESYTILRPGFLHIDYTLNAWQNYPEIPKTGELAHCFDEGGKMPHTDASDIGKYAAAALSDPAKFNGAEIEMGNENLSIEEVRDVLVKVSGGKTVQVRKRSPEEAEEAVRTVPGQGFNMWANHHDLQRSVAASKEAEAKFGIPFNTFEKAMERERALLIDTLPA